MQDGGGDTGSAEGRRVTSITRRIEWDMGHRVTDHGGKCRNLHGHRYVAEFRLRGPVKDEPGASDNGMVLDFGEVKARLAELVDAWDHGLMLWVCDPILPAMHTLGQKLVVVPYVPTAENIAGDLLERATEEFGPAVEAVTVHETPNCRAEARRA